MEQTKAMLASWARSFLSAALAVWLAGVTDWKTIGYAGAAAGCTSDLALAQSKR